MRCCSANVIDISMGHSASSSTSNSAWAPCPNNTAPHPKELSLHSGLQCSNHMNLNKSTWQLSQQTLSINLHPYLLSNYVEKTQKQTYAAHYTFCSHSNAKVMIKVFLCWYKHYSTKLCIYINTGSPPLTVCHIRWAAQYSTKEKIIYREDTISIQWQFVVSANGRAGARIITWLMRRADRVFLLAQPLNHLRLA